MTSSARPNTDGGIVKRNAFEWSGPRPSGSRDASERVPSRARHPGHNAPRPCYGLDNPAATGSPTPTKTIGTVLVAPMAARVAASPNGKDQVNTPDAQRTRGFGQRVDLSAGESDFEDHVAALFQGGRLESGLESLYGRRCLAERRVEHTDSVWPDLPRLLCLGRERREKAER